MINKSVFFVFGCSLDRLSILNANAQSASQQLHVGNFSFYSKTETPWYFSIFCPIQSSKQFKHKVKLYLKCLQATSKPSWEYLVRYGVSYRSSGVSPFFSIIYTWIIDLIQTENSFLVSSLFIVSQALKKLLNYCQLECHLNPDIPTTLFVNSWKLKVKKLLVFFGLGLNYFLFIIYNYCL